MIKNLLFILFHVAMFGAALVAMISGLLPERFLAAFAAAFSLEAVLLAVYFRIRLKRTVVSLKSLQKEIEQDGGDGDWERLHRELLYLGHQIKTMQSQIDAFKKVGFVKINGNGHPKGVHL